MQTYLYSVLNSRVSRPSPLLRNPFPSSAEASPPAAETLASAAAVMASSNVSTVYISVIDDVISKVREDFITYGVGDAVLNELQAVRTSDLSIFSSRPLQFFLDFSDFDGCLSDPAEETLALGDENATLWRDLGEHRPNQGCCRVRRRHHRHDTARARPERAVRGHI
jgi:hypothetical protein